MIRFIFAVLVLVNIIKADAIWSDDTNPATQKDLDNAIKQYDKGWLKDINVFDKSSSTQLPYKNNLMVVGIKLGGTSFEETLKNQSGSKTHSFSTYDAKLMIGKDFELWHKQFHQYSRLYIAYNYSKTDDVKFQGYGFGIVEKMKYWTFYNYKGFDFYPSISFELGTLDMDNYIDDVRGYYFDYGISLSSQYKYNYEFSLDLNYKNITWNYPVDGIDDEFAGVYVGFSFTYRIMYGDF
jgi:hypothetical protein